MSAEFKSSGTGVKELNVIALCAWSYTSPSRIQCLAYVHYTLRFTFLDINVNSNT